MLKYSEVDDIFSNADELNRLKKVELDFILWVKNARKGQINKYYLGASLLDSITSKAVQAVSYHYYTKGLVELLQKKIGPFHYEYRAYRTGKRFDGQ